MINNPVPAQVPFLYHTVSTKVGSQLSIGYRFSYWIATYFEGAISPSVSSELRVANVEKFGTADCFILSEYHPEDLPCQMF